MSAMNSGRSAGVGQRAAGTERGHFQGDKINTFCTFYTFYTFFITRDLALLLILGYHGTFTVSQTYFSSYHPFLFSDYLYVV
jgi:hypothetical protein